MSTKRGTVLLSIAGILLLIAAWAFCPDLTADELQLRAELRNLQYGDSVPLSSFTPLKQYDNVCMIDAYAIKPGTRQEESVRRIFGSIDYSQFRDEIIRRYTDYYAVGIYPVKNNRLMKAMRMAPGHHTYMRLATDPPNKDFTISACYKPADVCLRKTDKDSYGDQPITIGLCHQSAKESSHG